MTDFVEQSLLVFSPHQDLITVADSLQFAIQPLQRHFCLLALGDVDNISDDTNDFSCFKNGLCSGANPQLFPLNVVNGNSRS